MDFDPFTQCGACYCEALAADDGVWYCPWCSHVVMIETEVRQVSWTPPAEPEHEGAE